MNKVKIIEDFIFDDKVQSVLSQLNNSVIDYNILEITGMGNQEIKHSNVLGWIFSNSEHNIEYLALDNFLKKVIEYAPDTRNLKEYIYLSKTKRDIIVYREKDNIDLLIVDKLNKIVIAIENKVYATERRDGDDGGQLQKYEDIVNEKYFDYEKHFVFLTINLEKPSKDNWLIANYKMITDSLEEILVSKELSEKTKIIFESYVDLLKRSGIVVDEKIQNLCEKIWSNEKYANAIDILLDYRVTPVKMLYDRLKEKLKFYDDNNFLELDGIKMLYKSIDKEWENAEEIIFEINVNYFGGKNDYVWIGFWHPDLYKQDTEFQKICRKITGKKTKNEVTILKIDRDYLANKDIDTIVSEAINIINTYNQKIIKELNA